MLCGVGRVAVSGVTDRIVRGHAVGVESTVYQVNRFRGPFNAFIFSALGGYLDLLMRARKQRVYVDLPGEVVELGPGVGANFRYLPAGTRVIGVEPNSAMHPRLRQRAARAGVDLDLRTVVGESIDVPDASVDMVISSLVLCTVADPPQVLTEVLRVLRPGGRFAFVEHVAAEESSRTRRVQRWVRRPWAWTFEGCSCERDVAGFVESAGFSRVDVERYRARSPLLPFNPQVAGVAVK